MEHTGGIRRFLSSASAYSLFQHAIGADIARGWLLAQLPPLRDGLKVVDVGCGPGDLLRHLPMGVEYVGVDHSSAYIATAAHQFRDRPRATFIAGSATNLAGDSRVRNADVVIFHGVLHHLNDDEALHALTAARDALAPGGLAVALEPCFLLRQGAVSRWLMNRDRGADIRDEQQWRDLVARVFPAWRARVLTHLIRIPYVHIFLEGFRPTSSSSAP
jgi:SAM-dependent methyltransferase